MDGPNHRASRKQLKLGFRHLALLGLALCASACHYKVVQGGALDQKAVIKVARRVSEIRKLEFVKPIHLRLSGTADLKQSASSDAGRSRLSGRADRESKLLTLLGLIPAGTDSASAMQAIVSSQPAGLYLPKVSRLEIVDRDYLHSEVIEVVGLFLGRDLTYGEIVAHELTHALQEQHFGLDPPDPASGNQDAGLAHVAAAEGDAALVGFELGVGGLLTDPESFIEFARKHAPEMGGRVPSYFQERFKFPYLDGARFALALKKHGGFEALNRALVSPPQSSEQIMHPEKYLGGYDPPRLPDLTGLEETAGGFRLVHQDTLGEFGIRVLMSFGDAKQAARRAAGWGGDRAAMFERSGSPGLMLVWVVDFDSQPDAADFLDGLDELLSARHGQPEFTSPSESRWMSQEGIRHLELWDRRVVLVDAPPGFDPYRVVQAAWRAGVQTPPPAEARASPEKKPLDLEETFKVDPAVTGAAPGHSGPLVRIGTQSTGLTLGALLQVRGQRGGDTSGMAVQRLRARALGTATEILDLSMSLEFELAEPDAGLLDALISFTPVSRNLAYVGHLRIGRFRVPYSRSVLTDPEHLPLNQRTFGAIHLSPMRRTGLYYDLDLEHHGIPLRLRAGAYDGFPEAQGRGPLYSVRLDFRPSYWIDPQVELSFGAAFLHDAGHEDQLAGLIHDRQGLAFDALVAVRGYHLLAEMTLLDRQAGGGLDSRAATFELGAFLLPDFLQLVGRYEWLQLDQAPGLQQLGIGVNLFYLSERFKMSYNFVWQEEDQGADFTRHLIAFQLLI